MDGVRGRREGGHSGSQQRQTLPAAPEPAMKSPITAVPSVGNTLVASNISRPGRNEICIQQLEQQPQLEEHDAEDGQDKNYTSNIEFQNDESVATFRWIREENQNTSAAAPSRKRRNSDSSANGTANTDRFTDCLVILLATGEILIYSTSTREFVNKISTDSPFSAIEVINKVGHSKKALASYDYDLIAFDAEASSLKFFSSTSPQLVNSVPFKDDNAISYILFNTSILESGSGTNVELILASSSALYLLDPSHEVVCTIDINTPSAAASSTSSPAKGKNSKAKGNGKVKGTTVSASSDLAETSFILKIVKQGNLLFIIRTDSPAIQVVDIDAKEKNVRNTITASDNITDLSLLNINKSLLVSATLVDGSVELFQTSGESSFAKLEIEGGSEVGRFVALLDSSSVIDGVYKGIWFDNFNIQITDFEFENISKLKGTIRISVTELADPTDEIIDLGEDDEEDEEDNDEGAGKKGDDVKEANSVTAKQLKNGDADVAMDNTVKNYKCNDLTELTELIRPRLVRGKNSEVYDDELAQILSQNADLAKSVVYLLSAQHSIALFSKVAFTISQYQNQSLNQDFGFIANIKIWLQWLLVLRGSVLSEDDECVGWLRLLQSEFKHEARTLNGMIKLTGKLSLLRDQLTVRKEMMRRNVGEDVDDTTTNHLNEDDTAFDETTFGEDGVSSVVLDGEGGYDDDDGDDDGDAAVTAVGNGAVDIEVDVDVDGQ